MPLNIVCCVKQVPDPETPASAFKVDEAAKKVVPAAGIAPVISQFDQIAVEAALRIRDAGTEAKIWVISLGPDSARDVIKVGLAMGADEGVLLNDPALFDGLEQAGQLVKGIRRPRHDSSGRIVRLKTGFIVARLLDPFNGLPIGPAVRWAG